MFSTRIASSNPVALDRCAPHLGDGAPSALDSLGAAASAAKNSRVIRIVIRARRSGLACTSGVTGFKIWAFELGDHTLGRAEQNRWDGSHEEGL